MSKRCHHIRCTNSVQGVGGNRGSGRYKLYHLVLRTITRWVPWDSCFPRGKCTGRLTRLLKRLFITKRSHFSEKVPNPWNYPPPITTPQKGGTPATSLGTPRFPTGGTEHPPRGAGHWIWKVKSRPLVPPDGLLSEPRTPDLGKEGVRRGTPRELAGRTLRPLAPGLPRPHHPRSLGSPPAGAPKAPLDHTHPTPPAEEPIGVIKLGTPTTRAPQCAASRAGAGNFFAPRPWETVALVQATASPPRLRTVAS